MTTEKEIPVGIDEKQAADLLRRSARVRVHSGAVGCENVALAEGKVIAWCAAPSLTIVHDDGTRSSWSAELPIVEVEWEKAVPYRIYSRWVETGQTPSSVWTAIQEAYAAGRASEPGS